MKLLSWRRKRSRDLHRKTDQAREESMAPFFDGRWPALEAWNPEIDVLDGEKEVTVRAEVPGIDPKDLDVSVSGSFLTIAGEKKSEHTERKKDCFRSECRFGTFRRTLRLPEGVDSQKVTAEHSNGILTVKIAKSVWALPKRIAISRS